MGLRRRKQSTAIHDNIHATTIDGITNTNSSDNEKDDVSPPWLYDNYDCPATRAANAVQVLASQPLPLDDDDEDVNLLHDKNSSQQQQHDLSRMDTVPTSHHFDSYTPLHPPSLTYTTRNNTHQFSPTPTGHILSLLSNLTSRTTPHSASSLAGFLALLLVTCANYVLGPMRDAAALAVGVRNIPLLTLISTVLALGSSVPVGWLFEAPDPKRRRVWRKLGLTRGETQGTSLALFYRVFAFLLVSYALGFWMVERNDGGNGARQQQQLSQHGEIGEMDGEGIVEESLLSWLGILTMRSLSMAGLPMERVLTTFRPLCQSCNNISTHLSQSIQRYQSLPLSTLCLRTISTGINQFGSIIYVMFFLVVHLMKLHSLSLIWGVTTEAMEYEENAERRKRMEEKKGSMGRCSSAGGLVLSGSQGGLGKEVEKETLRNEGGKTSHSAVRLKRLGFVGFGGTLGGILGR